MIELAPRPGNERLGVLLLAPLSFATRGRSREPKEESLRVRSLLLLSRAHVAL